MNELKYISQFKKYLDNYQPSPDALKVLAETRLSLLVAPSSSGRNTIIRELEKKGGYRFIISDTTRKPRVNDGVLEKDGREYWFRTEEEILEDVKNGEFLEAAIIHNQQVSGTSIRELAKACAEDKLAVADVEVVGAANIHRAKPDTHIIFVLPPNFPVWIERLHHRGALPEDEVRRRLESAVEEFEAALEHDYFIFVVNDELHEAVERVHTIASRGSLDEGEQERGREIVAALLKDTRAYLSA